MTESSARSFDLKLTIESDDPLRGAVQVQGSERRLFAGWLDLLRLLTELVRRS